MFNFIYTIVTLIRTIKYIRMYVLCSIKRFKGKQCKIHERVEGPICSISVLNKRLNLHIFLRSTVQFMKGGPRLLSQVFWLIAQVGTDCQFNVFMRCRCLNVCLSWPLFHIGCAGFFFPMIGPMSFAIVTVDLHSSKSKGSGFDRWVLLL